jgi:hypothetical protein
MQPAKKQRDTNKSSLYIFILKMTIKALEKKSDEFREQFIKVLNDKDKYAEVIGNIQDNNLRKKKIIQVFDLFSKYLDCIVKIKKIKEKTRNHEEIQERINNSYNNIDNNPSITENSCSPDKKENNKREMKNNNDNNCLIGEKDSIKEKDINHSNEIENNGK